jgi:hypothetical protein
MVRNEADRLEAAIGLAVDDRRQAFAAFFTAHPGPGRTGLGLGTALSDFLEWEVTSGRVADGPSGSRWWKAVNGLMVLDVVDVTVGADAELTGAARAWASYVGAAVGDDQAALWQAHQASMAAATSAARSLLDAEPADEVAFIAIVLDVLERATARCSATDDHGLGGQARSSYPMAYPAPPGSLAALEGVLYHRRPVPGTR